MSAQIPSHTSRPPASLPSLPSELLTKIVNLLDRPSAISLTRVCARLTNFAEVKIWESVDLSVPPFTGDPAWIEVAKQTGPRDTANTEWIKVAQRLDAQCRADMKARVRGIVQKMDEKRGETVSEIRVVPRAGSLYGIVQILELASANLQTLTIEDPHVTAPGQHDIAEACRAQDYDTLDIKLLDAGLSFPALTHVTLGPAAIRFARTLHQLCVLAPNLEVLDASVDKHLSSPWTTDPALPRFPLRLDKTTRIKRLRLCVRGLHEDETPRDSEALLDLLDASPYLEQLSLRFWGPYEPNYIGGILAEYAHLRELDVHNLPMGYLSPPFTKTAEYPSLRRLVVSERDEFAVFSKLRHLPELETLHIHVGPRRPRAGKNASQPIPPSLILPSVVDKIRQSPHLRNIHFIRETLDHSTLGSFDQLDAIEASQEMGKVVSVRHGEEELLYMRLFVNFYEVDDWPDVYPPEEYPPQLLGMEYLTRDGEARVKLYDKREEPAWVDFTEFDGLVVPLEVLEEMRRVEGVDEWKGRGIEVKDETWAVLTAWRDGVLAERAAVAAGGE